MIKKNVSVLLIFFLHVSRLFGQPTDSLHSLNVKDTSQPATIRIASSSTIRASSFIVPAGMFAYGVFAIKNGTLQNLNSELRDEIYLENPHPKFHLDNYLQFAPAFAVYGLNAAGIHGRSNLLDRSMIYLLSNIFLNATVSSIKSISGQLRPDSSDHASFPSGHTAEAFASAEFMRMEYRDVSVWYGVAGYAMAVATGYLRMYNNKHWFSDVIAGAGVGIASTRLSYLLYPVIQRKIFKKKPAHTMIFPAYNSGTFTLGVVHRF